MAKEITSQTYDGHIRAQGLEYQVAQYYEPSQPPRRRRIDYVLKFLEPAAGERILDIGCGVGTYAFHSAMAGAKATGLDYSEESVKAARTLSARYQLPGSASFVTGNACKLPFEANSFDKIVSADFIEHITDDEKQTMMTEMLRVLSPGGRIVIFTPNAVREKIGDAYWRLRHVLFGNKIPVNDLHYGLIGRHDYEAIIKLFPVSFEFHYLDVSRPYLASIPLVRKALALNLLWVIRKP
ncbi:MAG: hypothetical protein A2314_06110 [Elusimicrobia bacterium RIFOXYB2_FULL_50_12]|nr:MAG: hypothetical protein A2314_06110 [Elusimicrobia bacterium RIFOXYB2_FULL_50_12]